MPVQQHSDPFEDRVAAELRDAGSAFHPDGTALAAAGLARGRRLRLRRRAAVVGGTASLALVAVGGTLLVLPGDDSARESSVAAKPSASASAKPVSDQELIQTLEELLGNGKFTEEAGRGTADELGPYAQLVWDDGNGDALVSVNLGRIEPGSSQAREWTTCPSKTQTPYDSCKTSRLPNGSLLKVFQGYEYPDKREETKWWTADLVTATGQHVSVSEWNSMAEKGAPVSRPNPPLNGEQLKELVTAPAWLTAVDSIPQDTGDAGAPAPEESGMTGVDIRKALVNLLPDTVDVVSAGNNDDGGWGYVVVNDGKGKSLVEINVQPGFGDLADDAIFSGAETLDDGTLVTTRVTGGDKGVEGVVMWTVDTLRTDGLRVVISAFNAGDQHGAPSREKPALTMKQLREIALSPQWR